MLRIPFTCGLQHQHIVFRGQLRRMAYVTTTIFSGNRPSNSSISGDVYDDTELDVVQSQGPLGRSSGDGGLLSQ